MNYEGVILVVGFPPQKNFHICSLRTDGLEKKSKNGDCTQIFQIIQSEDYFIVNRSGSCLNLSVFSFPHCNLMRLSLWLPQMCRFWELFKDV